MHDVASLQPHARTREVPYTAPAQSTHKSAPPQLPHLSVFAAPNGTPAQSTEKQLAELEPPHTPHWSTNARLLGTPSQPTHSSRPLHAPHLS
jgi:hypothetical protein